MPYRTTSLATLALLSAGAALADDHARLTAHVLAGEGRTIVTMTNLAKPDDRTAAELSTRLDAIAYRPVTGTLLGFSREGAVYAVDPATGALTDLGARFAEDAVIAGSVVALDFNNAIDAVRAVGSDGANLVYFPEDFGDERAGKVLRFTDVFYGDGDANAGAEPLVFANAYTNAIPGAKAGSTVQYALDANTDALVNLANNSGTLATVARVTIDGEPVDLSSSGGFDIVSAEEGADAAYAVLKLEGAATAGLYAVDLATAEATLIADLGMVGVSGFAVSPAQD